nr:hypothetical protein [uncultured Sphingomonas sp.]
MFGPLHAPLSAIGLLAVAVGWFFYVKRRKMCSAGADCQPPARSTFPLLVIASLLVGLAAVFPLIEAPLMDLFQ